MIENKLRPIHPGEILREEFLVPAGMTANALAKALRVDAPRINDIVRERRGITPDTALRLAAFLQTSAEFWLNLQSAYDLKVADTEKGKLIRAEIAPLPVKAGDSKKAEQVSGLFSTPLTNQCSRSYAHMLEGSMEKLVNAREHCESFWSDHKSYADVNFVREFAIQTHERWFEMYLTVALLRAGHKIVCRNRHNTGPDVLLNFEDQRIWIEATCASPGEKGQPDSIPKRQSGRIRREPTDQYVLRIRNALEEKQKKLFSYINKGLIRSNEPCIVAINVYKVDGLSPHTHDHVRRALYGIGDPQIQIDRRTRSATRYNHVYIESIRKSSGAEVMVNPFTDGSLKHISAVLISESNVVNQPKTVGDDFVLYPNLKCNNQIPQPLLGVGSEWRFQAVNDGWKGKLVER